MLFSQGNFKLIAKGSVIIIELYQSESKETGVLVGRNARMDYSSSKKMSSEISNSFFFFFLSLVYPMCATVETNPSS